MYIKRTCEYFIFRVYFDVILCVALPLSQIGRIDAGRIVRRRGRRLRSVSDRTAAPQLQILEQTNEDLLDVGRRAGTPIERHASVVQRLVVALQLHEGLRARVVALVVGRPQFDGLGG